MQSAWLFDSAGYVNIPEIEARFPDAIWYIIYGARGTGKTYGFLKYMLEQNKRFIMLRRTVKEISALKTPELNPYSPINNDYGCDIRIWPAGSDCGVIAKTAYNDKGKAVCSDESLGMVIPLSTFATIRSLGAINDYIVFDEFIPEAQVRGIKNEAEAVFNFYETVNRNRELQQRKPVKMFMLSNSNKIANPIFIELGLVREIEKMRKSGIRCKYWKERGLVVVDLKDSPISKQKRDTALYKLVGGDSAFSEMALYNDFNDVDSRGVVSRNLREYSPILRVGEVTVYKSKHANKPFYVSPHHSGSAPEYRSSNKDLELLRRTYRWLYMELLAGNFEYEDVLSNILIHAYFNIEQ